MTYENLGQTALDYFPCRYGMSKLLFRGPRRRLDGSYVAFLGGIETYGKFVEMPFPALVECETGIKSVNLGCVNAGIDAYATDKNLVDICAKADVTVIQMMGAQNMSNRFYAVHPRRNDRFLRASSLLQSIFGEVDFTDFNFTRHMLTVLSEVAPEKFLMVQTELKDAWVARMQALIQQVEGKVILLWLAGHAPVEDQGIGTSDPMFIDRKMINSLSASVSDVIEIVAMPQERQEGLNEMVFAPLEQPAAEDMLGPVVHRRAAMELARSIKALV